MTARDSLWDLAVEQHGYFSATQARELGITKKLVQNLLDRHQIERVAHGVYRFPEWPHDEYGQYTLAVLWTGHPAARLSHDTALAGYEVCDVNPDRTHVSVPRTARLRRAGGELYVVHHEDLTPADEAWWQAVPSVRLATAIRQSITSGLPTYLLRQALENGASRGLLLHNETEALTTQLEERHGQ
jgi:predicted transcriptional regulator of viral defense system